jgi:hypothetical protein
MLLNDILGEELGARLRARIEKVLDDADAADKRREMPSTVAAPACVIDGGSLSNAALDASFRLSMGMGAAEVEAHYAIERRAYLAREFAVRSNKNGRPITAATSCNAW